MVDTEMRLIIFFAAKDGEALYSQEKQDWELTVAKSWTPCCQIQTEIEEYMCLYTHTHTHTHIYKRKITPKLNWSKRRF